MWKNTVEAARSQMTIWYGTCALHAGYLRLQTHTYVILIAFLLQRWLHDCTSMLRYTYVAFFVSVLIINYLFLHWRSIYERCSANRSSTVAATTVQLIPSLDIRSNVIKWAVTDEGLWEGVWCPSFRVWFSIRFSKFACFGPDMNSFPFNGSFFYFLTRGQFRMCFT